MPITSKIKSVWGCSPDPYSQGALSLRHPHSSTSNRCPYKIFPLAPMTQWISLMQLSSSMNFSFIKITELLFFVRSNCYIFYNPFLESDDAIIGYTPGIAIYNLFFKLCFYNFCRTWNYNDLWSISIFLTIITQNPIQISNVIKSFV